MEYSNELTQLVKSKKSVRYYSESEKELLIYETNFLDKSENLTYRKYVVLNNLHEQPSCKICKKRVSLGTNKENGIRAFQSCCSKKCSDEYKKTDEYKEKVKKTCIEKYGSESYSQTEEFKKHLINDKGEYYFQTEEFKEKSIETSIKKYGVDNFSKSDEYKEKVRKTCIEKYGSESYSQTEEFKKLMEGKNQYDFKGYNDYIEENYKTILYNYDHLNYSYVKNHKNSNHEIYCKNCGKNFIISSDLASKRMKNNHILCTNCNKIRKPSSNLEKEMSDYIKSIYDGVICNNIRSILPNKSELDVYIPDLNLAFEFNGTHYHVDKRFEKYRNPDFVIRESKKRKIKNTAKDIWERDAKKQKLCKDIGIKLITIWEYDWVNSNENVKKMIEYNIKINKNN